MRVVLAGLLVKWASHSGRLLKLLLLTGQRRSEVAEMTWAELDGDTWNMPASRTKNGRPHVVPLSRQARDLIASVHTVAGAGYVFTTNGSTPVSGWSKVKAAPRRKDAGGWRGRRTPKQSSRR